MISSPRFWLTDIRQQMDWPRITQPSAKISKWSLQLFVQRASMCVCETAASAARASPPFVGRAFSSVSKSYLRRRRQREREEKGKTAAGGSEREREKIRSSWAETAASTETRESKQEKPSSSSSVGLTELWVKESERVRTTLFGGKIGRRKKERKSSSPFVFRQFFSPFPSEKSWEEEGGEKRRREIGEKNRIVRQNRDHLL